jgi:hypothetical protein
VPAIVKGIVENRIVPFLLVDWIYAGKFGLDLSGEK